MEKILIDTSPMVAIANRHEATAHRESIKTLTTTKATFITTIACLTEAMYFLGEAGGWLLQERIWKLLAENAVEVYSLTDLEFSYGEICRFSDGFRRLVPCSGGGEPRNKQHFHLRFRFFVLPNKQSIVF